MTSLERKVLAYLRGAGDETIAEQVAFTEIPCPDWRAARRGAHLARIFEAEGLDTRMDRAGNVVGVLRAERSGKPAGRATGARGGGGGPSALIVCAHIDSVFYDVREIKVEREGSVYRAPGICDNSAGVANLIMLARGMHRFGARAGVDVIFLGSTGEEGEGRLKGVRHFYKTAAPEGAWFIAIDGSGPGSITRRALASWSPRIRVTGPGGHSYGNFGRPNPVHMLSRFVHKVVTGLEADEATQTVFNATMISGGTAVNVIPQEACVTVNLRSSDVRRLDELRARVKRFLREAREEELLWATAERRLDVRYTALERPGGETSEDAPLVKAAVGALAAEGIKPYFVVKSTDANLPMSMGIPAITVSGGGRAGNLHALDEWHDMTGRTSELAALARMVFAVASGEAAGK